MEQKKIRILHFVRDDKFVDGPLDLFEQDDRFCNKSVLVVKSPNYQYRLIKKTDRIVLLYNDKMIKNTLNSDAYDVVLFYSLRANFWKYFKYIPQNKIVIWWAWGFDLYEGIYGLKPLIQMDFYKPETKKTLRVIKDSFKLRLSKLYGFFALPYYLYLQKMVLSRIDYFQPVWKMEYDILKERFKYFRAKEFYYNHSYYNGDCDIEIHSAGGNIIVGNSATPMNNHLDVLNKTINNKSEKQKILIPLNYGNPSYKDLIMRKIEMLNQVECIIPLKEFLPAKEYWDLFNSCSYACYGVIRQQAGANIGYALEHGIKVFLYKDSIAYQHHKKGGFEVFAIEDIDKNSFTTPINNEQAQKNLDAIRREYERRQSVYEACVMEIINSIVS